MRPIIGMTSGFERAEGPSGRLRSYVHAAYSDAIFAAGGIPMPIPTPAEFDAALIDEILSHCQGVLLTGGPDLDPKNYGQERHPATKVLHERRDRFDLAFFRRAAGDEDRPILAICLGCQIANVAFGGRLIQHVDDVPREGALEHHRPDHTNAYHEVELVSGSRVAEIVGRTRFEVNSRHHQAIDPAGLGAGLRPVGFAPDGVLEAVETTDERFLVAVQWHPEDMIDRPEHLRLFEALVEEARRCSRVVSP